MKCNKTCYTIFLLFIISSSLSYSQQLLSQNDLPLDKGAVTPTANNFAYPQSIFVDSPNGHIWVTDFDNHRVLRFDVSTLTAVEEINTLFFLSEYFLAQNFPNPFNPKTQISFSIRNSVQTSLKVYNVLGQIVATLFEGVALANTLYSFTFDAKNLPSGIYLYSLLTSNRSEVKKMILLK